jgi:hypothetical protein
MKKQSRTQSNKKKSATPKSVKGSETRGQSQDDRRQPTCADLANAQNANLARKCSRKVNLLDCRCSGCESDDRYPVILGATDAPLLNTAYDGMGGRLADSTASNPVLDLHWEVGLGNTTGPASVPSSSWISAFVKSSTAWVASPFGNAGWISYFQNAKHIDPNKNLNAYFRYRFNLGAGINPATFALVMDFYADNQVAEIYVNGVAQSASNPTILPQRGSTSVSDPYGTRGFDPGAAVSITLDKNWRTCDNEIVVYVKSSPGWLGLLVQNHLEVAVEENPCACHCECAPAKQPDIQPCLSVSWGDSKCDCIETDDVEVACLKVCNCYSNITFSDFSIKQIYVTDLAGNPVPNLPDGTPSVQVLPTGPICFGDIPPCTDSQASCVSRELVIYTRGAIGKKYRLIFRGICFKVCQELQSDQCFIMTLCQD